MFSFVGLLSSCTTDDNSSVNRNNSPILTTIKVNLITITNTHTWINITSDGGRPVTVMVLLSRKLPVALALEPYTSGTADVNKLN